MRFETVVSEMAVILSRGRWINFAMIVFNWTVSHPNPELGQFICHMEIICHNRKILSDQVIMFQTQG